MKVGFLEGDFQISIDDEGKFQSKAILSTSYNTIPLWLRISRDACLDARQYAESLKTDWPQESEEQKRLLLAELRPSMMALVGCAVAIDGIYDLIKPFAKIDKATLEGWKRRKKSRSKQVSETFRRAFGLSKEETSSLQKIVKEIFDLRDKAVHPSHQIQNAMSRADLPVGVDWRFAAYRFDNAATAYNNTIQLLHFFMSRRSLDKKLGSALEALSGALMENELLSEATEPHLVKLLEPA